MQALKWIDATLALTLFTSGLALRNCVLLGVAALFGVAAFYRRMDERQPGHPLQAALRCIATGVTAIVIAFMMGLLLVTGAFDFWPPVNYLALAAGALFAPIALEVLAALSAKRDPSFIPVEVLIASSATLALGLAANGAGWIACLYAGGALAIVCALGWHLARETAAALLRSSAER